MRGGVNGYANGRGNGGIAIGNILGSNIANILLVLGVSAIISPIYHQEKNSMGGNTSELYCCFFAGSFSK
ncbi:MAG: hypothetical protein C4B58_15110 [Deltaproteobacteria bacterium]|nr:MAG: hypothetical protein C4B58_15110 [Deltaproteobacteria bacterium]